MKAIFKSMFCTQTKKSGGQKNRQESSENLLLSSLEAQSPSPSESHLDNDVPPPRYPESLLAQLPEPVILRISAMLGVVSQRCLKYTDRYFRNLIVSRDTRLLRCVKWRVLTFLEMDLIARDRPLPDRLACRFCKCAHPREDFGVRGKNAGYGIEHLYLIERCYPSKRYCWRHIPKRLNYICNDEISNSSSSKTTMLSKERWVDVKRRSCGHCGTRLSPNSKGKSACSVCPKKCSICPSGGWLTEYERHGPQRPLESYTKIRFVRRRCTGFALEIRDLNGICIPNMPLSAMTWSATWSATWPILDCLEDLRIGRFLVRKSERRFPLYGLVDKRELQPDVPYVRIIPGGFFHACTTTESVAHNPRPIQKSISDIKPSHTNKAVERPTS